MDKKKKSFLKGVKHEWQKIVWTPRKTLFMQTVAVILASAVIVVLITCADTGALALIEKFMG